MVNYTNNSIKCPKCGKDANVDGKVSCLCDLDFCEGQRCGADKFLNIINVHIAEARELHQKQKHIIKHIYKGSN